MQRLLIPAALSLAFVVFIFLAGQSSFKSATPKQTDLLMLSTMEKTGISVEIISGTGTRLITIGNTGRLPMQATVRNDWVRKEVQGAPLSSIMSTGTGIHLTVWTVPPGSSIQFRAPGDHALFIQNTSAYIVSLRSTVVDIRAHTSESNVQLLQKSQPLFLQ